jgi:CheY-like chemotaxis protein
MKKQVLCVGNCESDHDDLSSALSRRFDVAVAAADGWLDAHRVLASQRVDLVLVNRLLEVDGGEGLEIIRRLKADPALRDVPVMLLSNYPDAQAAAVAAGAQPGFGKAQLGRRTIEASLARWLDP